MHLKTLKYIGLGLICSGLSSAPVKAGLFSGITNAGKKAYCFAEYSADHLNQRTYDKAIRECGKFPDSIPWFLNAACSQALEDKLKLSMADPNLEACKEQAEQSGLKPVTKSGKIIFKKKKAAEDDEEEDNDKKKEPKKKKKHKSEDEGEDESSKKVKKKKKAAEDDEEEEEEDPEKKKAEEAARKKKKAEEAARKKKKAEEAAKKKAAEEAARGTKKGFGFGKKQ